MRWSTRSAVACAALLAAAAAFGQGESPFATNDRLAKALQDSNVAIARTLQDRIDKAPLQALAEQVPADKPLKIGIVTALPETGKVYGTGPAYAKALHEYLGLGDGLLVLVIQKSGKVYAVTNALGARQVSQVLKAQASAIQNDPAAGIEAAARDIYERMGAPLSSAQAGDAGAVPPGVQEGGQDGGSSFLTGLLVVGGIVLLVVLASRSAKKRAAMAEARRPVEHLRGETVTDLAYADVYLELLPDTPDAQAAKAARAKSAELFDQARRIARSARTPEDLERAEVIMQQARDEAGICRQYLDRATGGTGYAVAVDGTEFRATPAAAGTRPAPVSRDLNIDSIPERDRAACYFCSRPSDIANLTPVTIAMDGQRRKVLACPDDVRAIREGAPPQVRTVSVGGQPRPWFAAPGYDPYRDYWLDEPVYAPAYWGAADAMWTGLMLGTMLSDPIPYPVYVDGGGVPTADPGAAFEAPPEPSDLGGVGEASFFGVPEASDFGGGADTGSTDFGSTDFGSSDFGSTDFGGSDFGGGDSGGGGDSF